MYLLHFLLGETGTFIHGECWQNGKLTTHFLDVVKMSDVELTVNRFLPLCVQLDLEARLSSLALLLAFLSPVR